MIRMRKGRIIGILGTLVLFYMIGKSRLLRALDYILFSYSYASLDHALINELNYSLNQVARLDMHHSTGDHKVMAAFVGLVRNSELDKMIHTVKQIEQAFNRDYDYPYVFLNDVPFTDEFKKSIKSVTNSSVQFGLIPVEHWSVPDWIDLDYFRYRLQVMSFLVPYGGLESYRHMCRYNSGFFYKHSLLANFDYYWRIEPDVDYYCKLQYDPFLFMKLSGKKYGYNIIAHEEMGTVNDLWKTTNNFILHHNITPKPLFKMFESKKEYNGLHFWSNFEIGDLNWFRGQEYNAYFQFLDQAGGFFYERWGDAPVHSIAAGMFLDPSEIHYFGDIGYRHDDVKTCISTDSALAMPLNCACNLSPYRFDWVYHGTWASMALDGLAEIRKFRNESRS